MNLQGRLALVDGDVREFSLPAVEPWNQTDLPCLLRLAKVGPGRWRSRYSDVNANGRIYGGQLLGQALTAALYDVPPERAPTMMQAIFLQGALPGDAIEFEVTALQDGRRFSSRRVSATQANGRRVFDAQVTCATVQDAPEHGDSSPVLPGERPEEQPCLADLPKSMYGPIGRVGGYSDASKPAVEFRVPDAARQLSPDTCGSRFRYWIRVGSMLPADTRVHAAALAYLSDWWLNFSTLGLHMRTMADRRLYISSLNHGLWLHRPVRADEWLHVETDSPASAGGRGMSVAKVHDAAGKLVASLAQQTQMVFAK